MDKKQFIKDYERMLCIAELRALSKFSLEHKLTKEQYDRMMKLKVEWMED